MEFSNALGFIYIGVYLGMGATVGVLVMFTIIETLCVGLDWLLKRVGLVAKENSNDR